MEENVFILSHWQTEQSVFKKNLEVLKDRPDKDAVHDLRVAVKKMRAIVELYVRLTEEKLLDNPLQETEQLFKVLGRQRDIEICLDCLDEINKESGQSFHECREFFHFVLKKGQHWTAVAVREFNDKEPGKIKHLLDNERDWLKGDDLVAKAIHNITHEFTLLQTLYKQPHKLRQELKKIFYWTKLLPGNLPALYFEKELHRLCDDLGNWQDRAMFINRVKHFRKDYLPSAYPEYNELKDMLLETSRKNTLLLRSSLQQTRRLCKKISLAYTEKTNYLS